MDRGISDEEVLRHLSKHRDCYLLSKDGDFHKRQVEKTALLEHRIGAFVITSQKNKTGPQLVQLIDKAWNRMQQYIQNHHRPFVVKILADGRIQAVH